MPALLLDSNETQINTERIDSPCGVDFIIEPNGELTISFIDKLNKKELAYAMISESDLLFLKSFIDSAQMI